jgi:hypothetical protein
MTAHMPLYYTLVRIQTLLWVDYNIHQAGQNFRIEGNWPGEVMGLSKDGKSKDGKENPLYKPGDVFRVEDSGWLIKIATANGAIKD